MVVPTCEVQGNAYCLTRLGFGLNVTPKIMVAMVKTTENVIFFCDFFTLVLRSFVFLILKKFESIRYGLPQISVKSQLIKQNKERRKE